MIYLETITLISFLDCLFENGEADDDGGMIYAENRDEIIVSNCSFNSGKGWFGGMIYAESYGEAIVSNF
jgi:hypothetical protein